MILESSINEVKAKMSVLDVVGEYVKLKKLGNDFVGTCPFHNENTPSFKIKKGDTFYKCFGCGKAGDAIKFLEDYKQIGYIEAVKILAARYNITLEEDAPNKPKVKPVANPLPLTLKQYEFFESRGITKETLDHFKITNEFTWMPKAKAEVNAICFNYFKNDELINIKYRAHNKDFKLYKDAEKIFYNIDSMKGEAFVVIVEGEMDCLTVHQLGLISVISVPNGASGGSQRLDYLDSCIEDFKDKIEIILLTDNDAAGIALRDELARRFGYERCFKVNYPPNTKDANEVLLKCGKSALAEMIRNKVEFPIEGIITAHDMFQDVWNYYANGYPKGARVGISGFDEHISFMAGQMTTVTGIPGSGKSEFVDYIMVMAAKTHGWKFAICSFENQPSSLHTSKLIEKYAGLSFAHRENVYNRLSTQQFEDGINFVNEHFYFINVNQVEITLDGILSKAKELVARKGVNGILIDPWNYIEHKQSGTLTETQYISECLTKIKAFCLTNGVHVFLVAHPTKLAKENGKYVVPTLYSISGSAHFFNKTDNGITVYRDFTTNAVDVHIQKVRYSWLGKIGMVQFTYDLDTRQYKSTTPTTIAAPF